MQICVHKMFIIVNCFSNCGIRKLLYMIFKKYPFLHFSVQTNGRIRFAVVDFGSDYDQIIRIRTDSDLQH